MDAKAEHSFHGEEESLSCQETAPLTGHLGFYGVGASKRVKNRDVGAKGSTFILFLVEHRNICLLRGYLMATDVGF